MIPSGTRFIGISPTVDLTERRSALLNKQTEPFTVDDIRGYKVYTALLTQVGGDDQLNISEGSLTIGVTYTIDVTVGNPDWTNVGAPNNNVGTSFVATGTTPNSWGTPLESQLLYNTGAPVVTVLENTIGNIWFTYEGLGGYIMNSDGLLPNYKTWGIASSINDAVIGTLVPVVLDFGNLGGPDQLYIRTIGGDFNGNSMLLNTPIEIRVYN